MPHELRKRNLPAHGLSISLTSTCRGRQDYKALSPAFMEAWLCTPALRPDIYQQVYDSLRRMVDIYFSHQVFWEISIYSVLLELFTTIGASHYLQNADTDIENTAEKQSENYMLFSNLLNFIDTHYADDLTLEQAAEYIGFSKYHFTRLFKQRHQHDISQLSVLQTDSSGAVIAYRGQEPSHYGYCFLRRFQQPDYF